MLSRLASTCALRRSKSCTEVKFCSLFSIMTTAAAAARLSESCRALGSDIPASDLVGL